MKNSMKRLAATLFLLGLMTSIGRTQIDIDLSVDITESEGVYTYVYTLENSDFSFQNINTFIVLTGKGTEIVSIEAPDNWSGDYNIVPPDELVGFQTGFSEDGIRCGVTDDFDITPGSTETFTVQSTWKPGLKEYNIGKTVSTDVNPCLFEGDFLVGMISSPSIPGEDITFEPCDFNEDGECDSADINNLARAVFIGDNEEIFDLTDDDIVDINDINQFLDDTSRFNGDSDFNGTVDFTDFLTLSGNFGNADLDWVDGDFDADGMVAFGDFLILSGNFGKGEIQAEAAAVPEPSTHLLGAFALLCVASVRRRRN